MTSSLHELQMSHMEAACPRRQTVYADELHTAGMQALCHFLLQSAIAVCFLLCFQQLRGAKLLAMLD
jgi:hypothetical protein